MDSDLISLLVFVAISALSALSGWLQKRKQASEGADPWPHPSSAPSGPIRSQSTPPPGSSSPKPAPGAPRRVPEQRTPRRSDWEVELRRLLEGVEPVTPAPLPPVIVAALPPPRVEPARSPAATVRARPSEPIYARATEESPAPSLRLALFQQSADAHARAAQLSAGVAARMRRVDRLTEEHRPSLTSAGGPVISTEALAARAWLAEPGTLRQAIIASVILGPPRCAEI